MKELSARLRELRKLNNYSQEFVASHLNISRQAYSHYETGRNTPPADVLLQLSQLYQLPAEEFLIQSNPVYATIAQISDNDSHFLDDFLDFFSLSENDKYRYLSRNEKLLLYFFQKLPDEEQNDLIEFVKIRARHSPLKQ